MTDAAATSPTGSWPYGRSRHGGVDEIPLPLALDGSADERVAGRLWMCGKHAIGPDPEALIAEIAATTVVCLTERFELQDRYPQYVAWLDANRETRAMWLPVADLHAPSLGDAQRLVDEIRSRLAAGERIIVHCAAGIGRAGTIVACVLVAMGMPAETALAHLSAHRPMAGPEAGAQRALIDAVEAAISGPPPPRAPDWEARGGSVVPPASQ